MLYASNFVRWLRRKQYQYEVTFSLYMLTPTEKFIFSMSSPFLEHMSRLNSHTRPLSMILYFKRCYSFLYTQDTLNSSYHCNAPIANSLIVSLTDTFLILFLSMIIVAASLYLPGHITTMISRAWFYYAGDETVAATAGVARGAAGQRAGAGFAEARLKDLGGRMEGQDVLDMLGTL